MVEKTPTVDDCMSIIDQNKQYKVFLVEVDDDDRERVIRGLVRGVEINVEPQYADIHTYDSFLPVRQFIESTTYTMNLTLMPDENGKVLVFENFRDEEE